MDTLMGRRLCRDLWRRLCRITSADFLALICGLALSGAAGAIELKDCRLPGLPQAVKCGQLARPLDSAQANGKQIDVYFAVLPAKARKRLPDPVFFIAGGPGQSAIEFAEPIRQMLGRLNHRRDIVLVDQRGTGRSTPLKCAELSEANEQLVAEPEAVVPLLHTCRARLAKANGWDSEAPLAQFGTAAAMADLDAVRAALGYADINLVGVSYGTRAALDYLRRYPAQVRRVVLDGVAPPDMGLIDSMGEDQQAAFDALLAACAEAPECRRAYPHLADDWRALLASLPRETRLPDAVSGKQETVSMTRALVIGAATQALYVPSLAAALPEAIVRARGGNFIALAGLVARAGKEQEGIALGMHFGVVCAEDYPRLASSAPTRDFGPTLRALYRAVCREWPAQPVAADYYTLSVSPAPVLLLGGGDDPATPPRHQLRVAQALGAKARSLVAPRLGHNVIASACGAELAQGFIDARDEAQALAVDGACLARIPRPPAFAPLQSGMP